MLQTLEEARALADKESIVTSLRHANFNMSRAAESLGISRVSLYRLIEKYSLSMTA
jgi:DNA-binding NtrC family response regulator